MSEFPLLGGNKQMPIPVSVLVGLLGRGKTTLLNYLLKTQHNRKIDRLTI